MKVTTDACLFGAWVADEIKNSGDKVHTLFDVGAGTGLLSFMIAQKHAGLSIDAIEIDAEACSQANENNFASQWHNRINIIQGDLRGFSTGKLYDVIISNPPFYENQLTSANSKRNAAHHSSEFSFNDLISLIKTALNQTGSFYILMPYKRKAEIKKSLEEQNLSVSKEMYVRQSARHDFSG